MRGNRKREHQIRERGERALHSLIGPEERDLGREREDSRQHDHAGEDHDRQRQRHPPPTGPGRALGQRRAYVGGHGAGQPGCQGHKGQRAHKRDFVGLENAGAIRIEEERGQDQRQEPAGLQYAVADFCQTHAARIPRDLPVRARAGRQPGILAADCADDAEGTEWHTLRCSPGRHPRTSAAKAN